MGLWKKATAHTFTVLIRGCANLHAHRGGGTLSGLFEPTVTAMLIVRYYGGRGQRRFPTLVSEQSLPVPSLTGDFLADLGIHGRGANAPKLPGAEKPMAAGIAAIGRKSKPALQHNHRPGFHSLARNMFQVEVAASRTMSVALERGGHAPAVESVIASMAPPRPQANHTGYEIEYATSMRSKTIGATTLRTNHRHPASVSRRIPKTAFPGKTDARRVLPNRWAVDSTRGCRIAGERILNVRLHIRARARWN